MIVCENEHKALVGMALFYLTFSTWKGRMMYLEDIVVTESMRRHGVGRQLFERVLLKAKEQNCQVRFAFVSHRPTVTDSSVHRCWAWRINRFIDRSRLSKTHIYI